MKADRYPTPTNYQVVRPPARITIGGEDFRVYEVVGTENYTYIVRDSRGAWMVGHFAEVIVQQAKGDVHPLASFHDDGYGFIRATPLLR